MTVDLRRIKAERIAKGFTQDEMADMLGWKNRALYAKRENGIVSIGADELAKIAEVLGFSKDELGIFFTTNVPNKERN
ncbi:MAG TPA: helix-turn-helix domain-containing protein [Candidatus Jeotgalibaca merdavium]|uniref:Helix-turn-helix domain-containing protein n=1 Tax=Candidatus Jeotgalibaca merdavium TaxID=2838627 RepID=A0A9D2KZN7_9LACT|nr:helix-turn-helix domain-containing protein [Candidatus Jeotgalibaca merdavium]